jgi:hypothetical protein
MASIQIRNVPEPVHNEMKRRAAAAGQSLSDYLLVELQKLASYPTLNEWLDELDELDVITAEPGEVADAIRISHEDRDGALLAASGQFVREASS